MPTILGKIQYYCRPPAVEKGGGMGESDSKVLSSFSKELDIDALRDEGRQILSHKGYPSPTIFLLNPTTSLTSYTLPGP